MATVTTVDGTTMAVGKLLLTTLALVIAAPAFAGQQVIDDCYNCRVIYNQPRPVVKKVVRPRTVVQQTIVQPQTIIYPPVTVPIGGGIVSGTTYIMPVTPQVVVQEVPVVVPQPVVVAPPVAACTTYPDPWDTFGYIFGDPFMVQSCVYR
jgi:hypothetical protein